MKHSKKLKILIADQYSIVAEGLRLLISKDTRYEVTATSTEYALSEIERQGPDMLLLDICNAKGGSIGVLQNILCRFAKLKVLVFTALVEEVYAQRTLAVGAKGFLTKAEAPEVLFQVIETIAKGGMYVSERVRNIAFADWIARPPNPSSLHSSLVVKLSNRELEVFELLG